MDTPAHRTGVAHLPLHGGQRGITGRLRPVSSLDVFHQRWKMGSCPTGNEHQVKIRTSLPLAGRGRRGFLLRTSNGDMLEFAWTGVQSGSSREHTCPQRYSAHANRLQAGHAEARIRTPPSPRHTPPRVHHSRRCKPFANRTLPRLNTGTASKGFRECSGTARCGP